MNLAPVCPAASLAIGPWRGWLIWLPRRQRLQAVVRGFVMGWLVGEFTWRYAAEPRPQPSVTGRAGAADPESLGMEFRWG